MGKKQKAKLIGKGLLGFLGFCVCCFLAFDFILLTISLIPLLMKHIESIVILQSGAPNWILYSIAYAYIAGILLVSVLIIRKFPRVKYTKEELSYLESKFKIKEIKAKLQGHKV